MVWYWGGPRRVDGVGGPSTPSPRRHRRDASLHAIDDGLHTHTGEQKRLRPFNNPRQCMLAPRPKATFTKDAAAGNTNKPLFDIFRKPQKRQRVDEDDEVEMV